MLFPLFRPLMSYYTHYPRPLYCRVKQMYPRQRLMCRTQADQKGVFTLSSSLIAPLGQKESSQVAVLEAARLLAYDTRTIRQLIDQTEPTVVGKWSLCRVVMQSIPTR